MVVFVNPYIKKEDLNADTFVRNFFLGHFIVGFLFSPMILFFSLPTFITFAGLVQTYIPLNRIIISSITSLFALCILFLFWALIVSLLTKQYSLKVALKKVLEKYDNNEMILQKKLIKAIGVPDSLYIVELLLIFAWFIQMIGGLILFGQI